MSAVVVSALLFLATVVAGGLLSIEAEGGLKKVNPAVRMAISLAHKFAPIVIVFSTAVTLYLL